MKRYEWDNQKYWVNFHKHGIRFEEATLIFSDPNAIEVLDDDVNEERFILIGMNRSIGVLVVVFCERSEETIRIISARKATLKEEQLYEERIRFQ